ncbi:Mitochondrial distribution and morphology protein 31, mitochondrial precursor [Malassezia caprae]|uniref:Mitochondrial distribution and morphology protein 31, mitochondrial n=1 Tax=Malassezia caprae TaxID=1381934 RepID=A0AAF0E4G7_9BASI|nr:Mitochondrial distribution and morphology protein 31, mitochondrial precursor [Malassezia caprae]
MLVGPSWPSQLRAFSTPPKERPDESGQVPQGPSMYLQKASSTAKDLVDRSLFHNYPRSLRQLALKARSFAQRDGQGPDGGKHGKEQRPTKDELLRIARGFWTRMRIHFKWFTIRGFRRFNIDDLSAFFTLGGLGTAIWVIVGTTTFVSVIFVMLNALNLQEWFAMQLAKFLSRQTGFTVVCGSAIVPKWKEGRISFKDVVITRRAEPMDPERLRAERQSRDSADKRTDTHLLEMRLGDEPTIPAFDTGDHLVRPIREEDAKKHESHSDTNFSMFELRVDSIDVQLSLRRWLDGHGFLHKMDVRGIRGIVDRRHVFWDPNVPYDPRRARRTPKPNDIDLDSFTIEDFLVTVYQPGDFRPFNVSIFNASFPRLRTQWLFYDMLNADSMTGQLDGCLFSLHKPQSAYHTTRSMYSKVGKDQAPYIQNWSRLRVDGVNIDHVQKMAGLTGPLMWIYSGRFDLVADIKFPRQYGEDVDINMVISEILENLNNTFAPGRQESMHPDDELIPGQPVLSGPAILAPVTAVGPVAERARQQRAEHDEAARQRQRPRIGPPLPDSEATDTGRDWQLSVNQVSDAPEIPPSVVIELDIRFKDIKASMPIFTRALSYSTYALARPIVAFMNANKTLIPVNCRVVMDLIWEAMANHVASQQANNQRVRNVSLWTLSLMAQSLLRIVRQVRDTLVRAMPTEVPAT